MFSNGEYKRTKKKLFQDGEYINLEKKLIKKNHFINDVIEKPKIKDAPSNRAVIGRYILPKKIFNVISKLR